MVAELGEIYRRRRFATKPAAAKRPAKPGAGMASTVMAAFSGVDASPTRPMAQAV